MASAHIVFGKVTKGQPVMDTAFVSESVANSATSSACPGAYNFVSATAIDGPVYLAFSIGTPNANSNPRYYLTDGAAIQLSCPVGTKVHVLSA